MQPVDIGLLLRETLLVTLKLGAPLLLASLAVGLLVSVLQAVTQVNEATLAFVPKVLAMAAVALFAGSFMLGTLIGFGHMVFDQIVAVGGS